MTKILRYYIYGLKTSCRLLFVYLAYVLTAAVMFTIVGVCKYPVEEFSDTLVYDAYVEGRNLAASNQLWMLFVACGVFSVFICMYFHCRKRYKWAGVKTIPTYSIPSLVIGALIANIVISFLAQHFAPYSNNDVGQKVSVIVQSYPISLLIASGIIAPLTEEIMFRFLIYNYIKPFGYKTAILVSSILFSVSHGSIVQMLYALAFGVIFCVVDRKYESLTPSIIMHCIVNCSTILYAIQSGG